MDRSLIARWHGTIVSTGDGSGGAIVQIHGLYTVCDLFGAHTLFDVQFINHHTDLAAQAPDWHFFPYEPSSGIETLQMWQSTNVAGLNQVGQDGLLSIHKFKFAFQFQQASYPIIECAWSVNTNLKIYRSSLGGFVYDERLL